MGKSKRERDEPCAVCGHHHDYAGGEPCDVCGHVLPAAGSAGELRASALPAEVAPGVLVGRRARCGGFDNAARCDQLRGLKVTHVLSLVPTAPELYPNSFTYHTVRAWPPPAAGGGACAPDAAAAAAGVAECVAVANGAVRGGGRVLIMDMSGVSRAPVVAAACLLAADAAPTPDAALAAVAAARPGVAPTAADAELLQAYHKFRGIGDGA